MHVAMYIGTRKCNGISKNWWRNIPDLNKTICAYILLSLERLEGLSARNHAYPYPWSFLLPVRKYKLATSCLQEQCPTMPDPWGNKI